MGHNEEQTELIFNPRDIYKIVLDTRNFEISMFWQRSNYLLVLNSAIALGFFQLKGNIYYSVGLAIFGLWSSIIWLRLCLGAKFWQDRWEHRLEVIELKFIKEKRMSEDLKMFSADWDTIYADVEASIKRSKHKGFRRLMDCLVLYKPSVSYAMMLLSMSFILGWFIVLIVIIVKSAG